MDVGAAAGEQLLQLLHDCLTEAASNTCAGLWACDLPCTVAMQRAAHSRPACIMLLGSGGCEFTVADGQLVAHASERVTWGCVRRVLTRRHVCRAGVASAVDIRCSLLLPNACSRYALTYEGMAAVARAWYRSVAVGSSTVAAVLLAAQGSPEDFNMHNSAQCIPSNSFHTHLQPAPLDQTLP